MSDSIKILASGDSFTTRRIPNNYPGRAELQRLIEAHDVSFNNLEMTYHYAEGAPAAFSGGTWAMADPTILDDMNALGFNLYNTANNHSMDYGPDGLMATVRHLKERDMLFSGTGGNLYEAGRAAYLETAHARVALIGVTADFHDSDLAGPQGPVMRGRPGVNGLRVETSYFVPEESFRSLQELVRQTNMNYYEEYGAKLGYLRPAPEGQLTMKGLRFMLSDHFGSQTRCNKKDLERILTEVKEARLQSDYVMVSVHTHLGLPENYIDAPEFLEEFAHKCVEAGADAVLGHGPHELRGIEIYQGKPIFYSLGNFIFETETVERQPAEAFLNKGLPADTGIAAYMEERSDHGRRGYGIMPSIWFSVLPSWTVEEGHVREIRLYPITLGMDLPRSRKGLPRLQRDDKVLAYLGELSGRYGTKIEIEDGVGVIRL